MDDEKIINLYWQRDEKAISVTKEKYGKFCYTIAYRILHNHEDAEECENDTYLDAWNSIPPQKPSVLSAFLGTITRRKSIDKWRKKNADKRGGGEYEISIYELENSIPDEKTFDEQLEVEELAKIISLFLRGLSPIERNVFVRRYWYFDSIKEICERYDFGQSKVKTMLLRTRQKLIFYLETEGFIE